MLCVLKRKKIGTKKITFVFQENFGEDPQKPLASLQAGIGGTGLTQKSGASGQKCIPWIVIGFFAIVIIQQKPLKI